MKAFSKSLTALFLLLALAPVPAWSQSFELLHVAPLGRVERGQAAQLGLPLPSDSQLVLNLAAGQTSSGLPGFLFSLAVEDDKDKIDVSGFANTPAHVPGDNPLALDPRLPTRGTTSATRGIFETEADPDAAVPLTSRPGKNKALKDGRPPGPGTKRNDKDPVDVQADVLRDFDKAHPKPTKEEVKLRDAIKKACLHVEGHAAGIMRRCPKIKKGTVTVNQKPCVGYCQPGIPYILNKGQILIVHYPDEPAGIRPKQDASKKNRILGWW